MRAWQKNRTLTSPFHLQFLFAKNIFALKKKVYLHLQPECLSQIFRSLIFKAILCGSLQSASGSSCLVHQLLHWDFLPKPSRTSLRVGSTSSGSVMMSSWWLKELKCLTRPKNWMFTLISLSHKGLSGAKSTPPSFSQSTSAANIHSFRLTIDVGRGGFPLCCHGVEGPLGQASAPPLTPIRNNCSRTRHSNP